MKTVAVVPIKLNNQRLPQKNIKTFTNGKPLCWYILSTLLTIADIKEVYVYCSNPIIQRFMPARVTFLQRSASLDQDSTTINEVLKAFASDVDADMYVMTHATTPFVSAKSIQKGIDAVKSQKYDSAFAAKKIQDFLWEDGRPFNYMLETIPRTQDLPLLYQETSGFYIFERDVITKFGRRIGNRPFVVEVGEIEGVDIDEEEDFIIADAIFNHLTKNVKWGGVTSS